MTTWEPGAKDVLTHGFVSRPSSTAFLANNPAAIKTLGFDVFVHEVMAAINILPSFISKSLFETFDDLKSSLQ